MYRRYRPGTWTEELRTRTEYGALFIDSFQCREGPKIKRVDNFTLILRAHISPYVMTDRNTSKMPNGRVKTYFAKHTLLCSIKNARKMDFFLFSVWDFLNEGPRDISLVAP